MCKSPAKGGKNLMKFANQQVPQPFQKENKNVMESGVFYMLWSEDIA